MKLSKTHQHVRDLYHNEGHVKAWNYWKLLGYDYGIFLGEVPSHDFIDGEELCNFINLKYGVMTAMNIPWLKFILDGKILLVSKHIIRYGLSFDDINEVGAVTESQNSDITINGNMYLATLLRGIPHDQCFDITTIDTNEVTKDSEWNRLMYPIHKDQNNEVSPDKHSPYNQWADYSVEDLSRGSSLFDTAHTWCQDESRESLYRVRRGGYYLSSISPCSVNYSLSSCGYRPCLRLIEK